MGEQTTRVSITVSPPNGQRASRLDFNLPGGAWTGKISLSLIRGHLARRALKTEAERVVCGKCGSEEHLVVARVETGMAGTDGERGE